MHTFEITIQRQVGAGFPVIAEEQRDGGQLPVRVEGELRIDQNELLAIELDPAAYGRALGQALFTGALRDAFVEALGRAAGLLRVLLCIEDGPLRGLRWERLCAPIDTAWTPLGTCQRTPFSRYLPSLTDRRFPPIGRRDLRALILAASPAPGNRFQLAPFDVQASVDGVRAALDAIPTTLLADLPGAAGRPTLDALCAQITAQPISILHLVAHGRVLKDGESVVFLAGNDGPGSVDPVTGARLLERLGSLAGARGLPHFTFLSTCASASPDADEALGGLGQRLVRALGMPAVVAMTDKVSIGTANALAAAIYPRLRAHGEPDRALVEATVQLAERGDVLVPVLFSRLGGRPLFSDSLERALTPAELTHGLDALAAALPERAPLLMSELQQSAGVLRRTLDREIETLSPEARQERAAALSELEAICAEAVELSFQGLCLGEPPPAYDARCPFPGLRSFQSDAQAFFFGREALVEKLQRRIGEHPFLAVLGPSGSGKSSVIFAGLAPALQKTEPELQLLISFTPGEHPQASLAAALAKADQGARALLVADQFEEAFTLCQDPDERKAFFDELLKLPERHLVIITMRADFLGEVAPYPALRELMTARQELVAPMTPEELRRAMELQAAAVGLRFEADLGGQILDDVRDEPGAMPLLQHALQELWQRRRGRWLRAAEYRAIGGIQQAIAHSADQIYAACAAEDKERLRAIFVRLTRLDAERGEGPPRDTRQRVALTELVPAGADPAATRALVGRLADARLLVTGVSPTGETAEVAHEALIRGWPRLRDWLSEDRQGLLLREDIRQAARGWSAAGKKDGRLFRDEQLDSALALSRQPRFGLNAEEQQFLDTSAALREREAAEKEAIRQRELQAARKLAAEQEERAKAERLRAEEARAAAARQRRLTRISAGFAVGAALAALAAVLFLVQAQQQRAVASERRAEAVAAQATAISNEQTAVAERDRADENAEIANENAKIASENAEIADQNANTAISNGLAAAVQEAFTSGDHSRAIGLSQSWLDQDPDNGAALRALGQAAYAPGIERQFDMDQIEHAYTGNWVSAMALSSDGRLAATGHYSGTVAFWNVADGSLALQQPAEGGQVLAIAFSPRGDSVAVSHAEGGLRMLALSNSRALASGADGLAYALAFSPDGSLLASAHVGGAIIFWDVANLARLGELRSDEDELLNATALAFGPDGQQLLAGYSDGVARLWDLTAGEQLAVFDGSGDAVSNTQTRHSAAITSVAFAIDGLLAITGSEDTTIGVWDASSRSPIALAFLTGHTAAVRSVEVSPDDRQLLSASDDGSVRIWSLDDQRPPLRLSADEFGVLGAFFLPESDGSRAVSFGNSYPPRLWDLNDGRQKSRIAVAGKASGIDLSADGALAVASTIDGAVAIDVTTGTIVTTFSFPGATLGGISAIAPQGRLAASSTLSGTILLWDPRSGQPAGELSGSQFPALSMAFDPSGTRLAVATEEALLWVWDVANASASPVNLSAPFDESIPAFVYDIAWSPDGRSLLFATDWGSWLWSVDQRAVTTEFSWLFRAVHSVAFSEDGSLVALGSEDGYVYLASAADGQLVSEIMRHRGAVRAVAFSPDGARLVSAADDQRISIWELAAGTYAELESIDVAGQSIDGLAVAPGANSIISSGLDSAVRVWELRDSPGLQEWIGAHRYVPDLSCEDLTRYGLCDPEEQAATP